MERPPSTDPASGETAGVIAPPPVIYGFAMILGGLFHRIVPVPLLPEPLTQPVGGALAACAIALVVWAIVTMHRADTPPPPHRPTRALVTHGPFRFTRNPIYLGFTALQLGIACWHDSLWLVVTLIPAVAFIHGGVIKREERYLARRFGDAYVRYVSRVRRWV